MADRHTPGRCGTGRPIEAGRASTRWTALVRVRTSIAADSLSSGLPARLPGPAEDERAQRSAHAGATRQEVAGHPAPAHRRRRDAALTQVEPDPADAERAPRPE